MTTYTPEIRAKLERYLATHNLPKGMGSEESACSIAAVNLAISGKMTDDIPDCMSEVIGKATITLQDAMPDDMRNSARYKAWLPTAVGTGRDREQEQERLAILMDWMWGTVLPQLQPLADKNGFGDEWQAMCSERTEKAANAARAATRAARVAANAAALVADAAYVAANAAAYAAYAAADAADAAADSVAEVAVVAAAVAVAVAVAATRSADAARADFWEKVDPIGVLERMTNLEKAQ